MQFAGFEFKKIELWASAILKYRNFVNFVRSHLKQKQLPPDFAVSTARKSWEKGKNNWQKKLKQKKHC